MTLRAPRQAAKGLDHRARGASVLLVGLVVGSCAPTSSLETASANLDDNAPAEGRAPGEGGGSKQQPPPRESQPPPAAAPNNQPEAPQASAPSSTPAAAGDSPYISRSAGPARGAIVLWPRVIPRGTEPEARALANATQRHLADLVRRALPGREVELRPEPEQTCRKAGCDATAVGVMFSKQGNGCIAVAYVTPPGPVETRLVPWGGKVTLKRDRVPFRTPPEGEVTVTDYARCDKLTDALQKHDEAVVQAIKAATPGA